MTQRERAEQLLKLLVYKITPAQDEEIADCDALQSYQEEYGWPILEAALRYAEAATWVKAGRIVMDYNLERNHGRKATDMCDKLFDLLHAQAAKAREVGDG